MKGIAIAMAEARFTSDQSHFNVCKDMAYLATHSVKTLEKCPAFPRALFLVCSQIHPYQTSSRL